MIDLKFRTDKGKFSPLAIAGMVVGGTILAAGFAFLFGWVVMLLWNWLMPEIFGLPRIGYWQGWGLVLLSHILVKPGYPGGGGSGGKDKKKNRNEWKAEARAHFKDTCGEDRGPGQGEASAAPGEAGDGTPATN